MSIILDGSNGITQASWTTATRPSSPTAGQLGYNTTYGGMEIYNGSVWDLITGGPAFSAYGTPNQTVTTGATTKVIINTKTIDTNNNFDAITNYRFTPTIAGYYQINGILESYAQGNAITGFFVSIYKNGSEVIRGSGFGGGGTATEAFANVSGLIYMNGSTDYIELYGYITAAGTPTFYASNAYRTFSGSLVRSA